MSAETDAPVTETPLQQSDLPQVLEIMDEAERLEPANQTADEGELEELLDSSGFDLPRGSIALRDGDRLLAFGALSVHGAAPDRWVATAHGGVRTDRLGSGLGRRVLTGLADRARVFRDERDRGLPGELRLWVPERRERVTRLADSLGYRTARWFQDMRHDLADLPTPARVDGVQVLPWNDELSEPTRLTSNEAFDDHWGSSPQEPRRWAENHGGSSVFRPAMCRLALDDAGVVAFVLVEEYDSETAAHGYRTGYVSRVGTARRGRGRGIASLLVAEVLAALAADGYGCAELNVDSDSPTGAGQIYARLGFRPTTRNRVLATSL
jgi:mycothiol synthase